MRLRPGARAGDPDSHRSRTQRVRGLRGFITTIRSLAAGRIYTLGSQSSQQSGGTGSGSHFIGSPIDAYGPGGPGGGIPDMGDPPTGLRTAICGLCVCDSPIDICGP